VPERARVLLVDDLLATGGTADAALRLLARAKAEIVGCAFLVDLPDLGGRRRLAAAGQRLHWLCEFEGE
jgi:adenine phosphoribosyltransferase